MGKSSPSQPAAPNYVGAAQAQGAANLESAVASAHLSNPNIVSPLGTQTVTYGGASGYDPTVTQTLTPEAQATLTAQQGVQHSLADLAQQGTTTAQDALAHPFNPNLPGIQTSLDTSNIPQQAVNAGTTGQQAIMARLQPQIDQNNKANDQMLANQGLVPGGEAYDNAKRVQNQSNNDLYSQAALQGIGLDQTANNQAYNQQLQSTQFGNSAQQQSLAQQLALRNQPLNEISALQSGSQIQMPQFTGYQGQNVAASPIMAATQAQGQNALQNYGIQQSGANANTAGLYGLAGTGALAGASYFSDRRLKSDITRLATHSNGIGIYAYTIFGKRDVGVMADEVEAIMPHAVATHSSGYKMVDYGALNG